MPESIVHSCNGFTGRLQEDGSITITHVDRNQHIQFANEEQLMHFQQAVLDIVLALRVNDENADEESVPF